LLRHLHDQAPAHYAVLVSSGDVMVRVGSEIPALPEVDVLCLGAWVSPAIAQSFGVLFSPRRRPDQLAFVLQKPAAQTIEELALDHSFLVDTGIWLLSARALSTLFEMCGCDPRRPELASITPYELYATLGPALGSQPTVHDHRVAALTSAVLPLPDAEFHHFGTSRDLCRSSHARLQSAPLDRRRNRAQLRPRSDIFLQNSRNEAALDLQSREIWIENAHVPSTWTLTREHVITGAPTNDWVLELEPGACLDFVPIGDRAICVRSYGIDDDFRGALGGGATRWQGRPVREWFDRRGLTLAAADLDATTDLHEARLFPVVSNDQLSQELMSWLLTGGPDRELATRWVRAERLSAADLARRANLRRLYAQRSAFRRASVPALFQDQRRTAFFALDLAETAAELAETDHPLAPSVHDGADDPLERVHDHMFRAMVMRHRGASEWNQEERRAFEHLRDAMLAPFVAAPVQPRPALIEDQIVWGRSPVRLDLAGGWTDTPPYCLEEGGCVLNVAVDLNGQPPIQVFIKHRSAADIVVRSIDLGVEETITTYDQVGEFHRVGSAFSIARAALALCGFHPQLQGSFRHPSLRAQLEESGGGLEISLLAAVPKGSGLGTSSILAAAVLGTLGEVCGFGWTGPDLIRRTLVLEQLLTTGGGWQDQAGGILPSIKVVETSAGLDQAPTVRWLPDRLLSAPHANNTILLYYTGITRVAKGILQEIVRGMFLNDREHLEILREIGRHARRTCEIVQRADWDGFCRAVARSGELNQRLDSGTNPPAIEAIRHRIRDWVAGAKLLGAGGGGYLLMLAKDEEAARLIRHELTMRPPNSRARFVAFGVSSTGMQITKS